MLDLGGDIWVFGAGLQNAYGKRSLRFTKLRNVYKICILFLLFARLMINLLNFWQKPSICSFEETEWGNESQGFVRLL